MKKYEFTGETTDLGGYTLRRIRALRDLRGGEVRAGDVGGWVENESNLSHDGDCWVYGDAKVYGNAKVYGDAEVYDNAQVGGDAQVYGEAHVYCDAHVRDRAQVCGKSWVAGEARVRDDAWVCGSAVVCDHAQVRGDTCVTGEAWVKDDAMVWGNAVVCEVARVGGNARVWGNAVVAGMELVNGSTRLDGDTSTKSGKLRGDLDAVFEGIRSLNAMVEGIGALKDEVAALDREILAIKENGKVKASCIGTRCEGCPWSEYPEDVRIAAIDGIVRSLTEKSEKLNEEYERSKKEFADKFADFLSKTGM